MSQTPPPPPPQDPAGQQPPPQDPAPQDPAGQQPPPPPAAPAGQPGYAQPAYGQPQYAAAPTGAPVAGRPGELMDRFLARLIDGVIIGVAYGILSSIFRGIFLNGFSYSAGEWFLYWIVLTLIWVPLALGYFAFMDSTRGQTLGKMVMKLKVVGPNGGNPNIEQSVRRNIIYAFQLAAIIPILGSLVAGLGALIGVIMIAVGINNDPVRRQGWHDKFAGGTTVVKIG